MNNRYRLQGVLLLAAMMLTGGSVCAQTTIGGSVYGGGALADTGDTEVNLKGGSISGDVYGGGKGNETMTPTVGDTNVNLNKDVANNAKGCVVKGTIYGCNNLNGTPLGNAIVHIYKTQNEGATQIANPTEGEQTAKVKGRYDVKAVYGGGNLAAYIPTSDEAMAKVIVEGCDLSSIGAVYGGGNAAPAPATQVDVYGCYEIGEVFGGGNGKDAITINGETKENPGANVGYKDYSAYETSDDEDEGAATKALREKNYAYGAGTAVANIYGGWVHSVFGGSNTKGNIRVSSAVTLDQEADGLSEGCEIQAGEVFGAGRSAEQDGGCGITLGCISGLEEIYGGAYHANIGSDVTLTVTGGTIGRVFGGNNRGGTIGGTITVNIEETQCRPLIIGQVFGGGNQAAYTAPNGQHGPTINAKSFTSIGEIYGGGLGSTATVTGDTYVNIDEAMGNHAATAYEGGTRTFTDGEGDEATTTTVTLPAFTEDGIGAIGTVYGGGNEAKVDGNTHVSIGTQTEVTITSTNNTKQAALGANIAGNVYGGGNNADVTGNTNVVIGPQQE